MHPDERRIDIEDGSSVGYDYLVIATGPELAFDEIPGFGPEHLTQSVCHVDHAAKAYDAFENSGRARPHRRRRCTGRLLFSDRPMNSPWILDTESEAARPARPRSHDLRDARARYRPFGARCVGDTKSVLESELRERHIKWITNARVKAVADGGVEVEEVAEGGAVAKTHQLPFAYAMMILGFHGVAAVRGIEKLTNPRGFIGSSINISAIQPIQMFSRSALRLDRAGRADAALVGVPKTGFMIESMVTATAENIGATIARKTSRNSPPGMLVLSRRFRRWWRCFRRAAAIPPRNVGTGWRRAVGFISPRSPSKYSLRKVRRGESEPFYERYMMNKLLNIRKLKEPA